jgi:hypothetical protein
MERQVARPIGKASDARTGENGADHHRRMWAWIAGSAVVIGLFMDLVGLVHLLPQGQERPRLNGDINIAVARFLGHGSSDAVVQAAELSESLATELRRRGAADRGPLAPTVDVAGPEQVGVLKMARADGQTELDRINATIGISGVLESEPQATVLLVAIRMNERQLHLARQVGAVVRRRVRMVGTLSENRATRSRVLRQLVKTIDQVSDLLIGLGELESRHPRRARHLLSRALAASPIDSGYETLHLLLGHALVHERRYEQARAHYRRALEVRPGFPRARFALAALEFQGAAADCSRRRTDVSTLWTARRSFALLAKQTVSTLHAKALFSRARVDACLSQATIAHRFSTAKTTFAAVLAAYRSGTPDVRHEAAESLGWLAFIALPSRRDGWRGPGSSPEAAHYYKRAAALALDPRRRRFFSRQAQRWGVASSGSGVSG